MGEPEIDNIEVYIDYFEKFRLHKIRNGNCNELITEIKNSFTLLKNPYMFLLHCFSYNSEIYDLKPKSLAYTIVQAFKLYAKEHEKNLPDISIELQKDAYLIAKKSKLAAAKFIFKHFNYQKSKDIYLPLLKDELKLGNYIFVSTASIYMNLQNEFTPYELIVPLYFLNLSTALKEYMTSSESQSRCLLKTLDNFVGYEYNFSDLQLLAPCGTDMKTKSFQEVVKFVLSSIKERKIDPDEYPNIIYNHTYKTVYYLFKKHFCLKEMTTFAFCLFIRDFVQKIPALNVDVLKLFEEYDDEQVTNLFLKLSRNQPADLPLEVSTNFSEIDNDRYYQLAIDKSSIFYISNIEDFQSSIDKINTYSAVGIDCEWQPTTLIGSKEELVLIQIAVSDAVFLFDIFVLSEALTTSHWDQLGGIFSSSILKLTYGFKNDSKILSGINKTLASHLRVICNVVDFYNLKEALVLYNPSLFSYNKCNSLKGLSELVYLCFGKPLNKIYQYFYWIYRPLGFEEIQYSAIDAHCLIEIKRYMDGVCSEIGIEDWTKLKSEPVQQKKKPPTLPYNPQPVSVHEIKFVCDTMVQGLGRLLRHCGIDTKVLEQSDHHDKCVSYYEKEGRIALTRGSVYNRLTKFIPENSVHLLHGDTARIQLEEVVQAFNIRVTHGDIFGRCADCNCGSYLHASKDLVRLMKLGAGSRDTGSGGEQPAEWQTVNGGRVNWRERVTDRRVAIKVDDIPLGLLERLQFVNVCGGCGKCYWDGSHYERVLQNMLQSLVL